MLKVKPFRQKPGYCGPASLKMVFDYFGLNSTEKEIAELCGCNSKEGVEADRLLETAEKLGFNGLIKDDASFEDIRLYVKKKRIPVIVDWFSEDEGHYSVVVDIDQENIYFLDPGIGHVRAMRLDKFYRVWFDFLGEYLKSKENLFLRRMLAIYPDKKNEQRNK